MSRGKRSFFGNAKILALLVIMVIATFPALALVSASEEVERITIQATDVEVEQFDESFDLLDNVSAVDLDGHPVEVTLKETDGFDVSVAKEYHVTYKAIDPLDGSEFQKTIVATVKEKTEVNEQEEQNVVASTAQKTPRISGTVSNVTDLNAALATAAEGDIYTLASNFVSGNISITMPAVNVTIDGNGQVWNIGAIDVVGAGAGSLTIKNLTMDAAVSTKLLKATHSNGNLKLEAMTFRNAQSGALEVSTSNTATTVINKTLFTNNRATNSAPAIWVAGTANVDVNYSTIENSVSTGGGYEGGAIASKHYYGTLKINNTVFRNNQNSIANTGVVGGGGGAMAMHYMRGKLQINQSYFQNNKANGSPTSAASSYDGGAIYILDGRDGATIDIVETTFEGNTSYDDGGALMIQGTGNPGLTTNITNCTFYNNRAYGLSGGNRSGGAIQFFKSGTSSSMQNIVSGSTFVNNVSGSESTAVTQQGGAIGLSGGGVLALASVQRNNSLFFGNQVYGTGGVINTASNYKDVSNYSTTQLNSNVINADKGATPAYTANDVFGQNNVMLTSNASGVTAGVEGMSVTTIPIKPEGLAENTSATVVSGSDQRLYARYKDIGAVESSWVKYDANGGEYGLSALSSFDGSKYYEADGNGKFLSYYDMGYVNKAGTVLNGETALSITRTNYEFVGWSTDPSATDADPAYAAGSTVSHTGENITLYAVWRLPATYKVIYSGNGHTAGSEPTDATEYLSGATVTVANQADLEKEGYEFTGWNTVSNGSGQGYEINDTFAITADTTLYAQWKIKKYTVNFDSMGGTSIDSLLDVEYGSTIQKPVVDPTREGYMFKGWYKETNCTNLWTFGTEQVLSNVTLYAKWEKINPSVKPEPGNTKKPSTKTPISTGDTTNLYVLIGMISLSGAGILYVLNKRNKISK